MLPINVVAELFAGVGTLVEWMGGKKIQKSPPSVAELINWQHAEDTSSDLDDA
jgi:hypothetical protein